MSLSPYVASLRSRVGHDLILLPSVNVLIIDEHGRLCLVRNIVNGRWQIVGGAIEPDEEPALAARREAFEETGYEVEITRLIGVYGGEDYRLLYENGDLCSYVMIGFQARVIGGEAKPDGIETSEVGWFTPDEAMAMPLRTRTHRVIADTYARHAEPRF